MSARVHAGVEMSRTRRGRATRRDERGWLSSRPRAQPPPAHHACRAQQLGRRNTNVHHIVAVTKLPQLHIATSHASPTVARVVVVGEVDLATAAVLRNRLLSVLQDRNPTVVDVDLAGVTFLDCTGLGALVAGYNTAVRSGCQLRVSHTQPFVGRVLEVTGLLSVLTAPIERREPLSPESGYRPSATATVSQPPWVMVAA